MSETLHKEPLRFLVLVNREMSGMAVERALETVVLMLEKDLGVSAELTDSAKWYKDQFHRCGDWSSWIWETVTGKSYETRRPHFSGFVVCEEELGKANAQIVTLALRNNRAVLFCRKNQPLAPVTSVEEVDATNWKRGWKAKLEGIIQ